MPSYIIYIVFLEILFSLPVTSTSLIDSNTKLCVVSYWLTILIVMVICALDYVNSSMPYVCQIIIANGMVDRRFCLL